MSRREIDVVLDRLRESERVAEQLVVARKQALEAAEEDLRDVRTALARMLERHEKASE